jgi:hypothetical protein
MKSQILKIAGVKSEKEFYKKYPTEAAFFKAHPEAKSIKKAQSGLSTDANRNGIPDYLEINPSLGSNQFMTGNNAIGSFYQYQTPPAQYSGSMFKSTQMPEEDYGKPSGLSRPPQNWETPDSIPEGLSQGEPYGMNEYMQQNAQSITGQDINSKGGSLQGGGFNIQSFGNAIGGIKEGIDQYNAEVAETRKLQTWAPVSGVVKEAKISNAFLQKPRHNWFDPSDPRFVHNSSELSNIQGRKTDILATQNGGGIDGNPTEVQNTYAPEHTLFDDLGYVPLQNDDDHELKAYAGGGWFGQANAALSGSGNTSYLGNMGRGSFANSFTGAGSNYNGGWRIGSSVGRAFGGPLGEFVLGAVGGALDQEEGKQKAARSIINENEQFGNRLDMADYLHSANASHMENGGWVSNDWQPQVITTFGEHKVKDLLKPPHDADMLRAGGHLREYTPPSARAMETYENGGEMSSYAMGGKLQTHWGGHLETIAQNPYLEGSGEISMIHGKPHSKGGVGISYGANESGEQGYAASGAKMGAQVEAETREPIIEMAEGGEINSATGAPETSAVIFGNIPFKANLAKATGDSDLIKIAETKDGKTYKKIIADFAAPQNKAAKTIDKAAEIAANSDDNTYWGELDRSTARAMQYGGEKTQQQFANYIKKLARLQNATQDVKKETSYLRGKNISAEELGKGKIVDDYDPITKDAEIENPYAKSGAFLRKAQSGSKVVKGRDDKWSYTQAGDTGNPVWDDMQRYEQEWAPSVQKALSDKERAKKMLDYINNSTGEESAKVKKSLNKFSTEEAKINFLMTQGTNKQVGPIHHVIDAAIKYTTPGMTTPLKEDKKEEKKVIKTTTIPYERNKIVDIANMILPWFRRDELPGLDPRQLAGEYMARAHNQEEPVPLQQYSTELDPVYRISYQDVRDQNTADFRDAQRNLGYNPAAMAGLLGKKYLANQSVNAEEFRTNQAIENQIYGGNRAKVNQERMANIQLRADQMAKQALTKSKTQEKEEAIVSSIADKYLQHDARNLEYNVYKNMFPQYGFDPSGRIHTQGPWYQPNIPQMYGNKATLKQVPIYGADGQIDSYKLVPIGDDDTTEPGSTATPTYVAKNGKSVSKKNNRNSSIVKAYKNL